jgi:uncharacterized protein (UPF0276 family)
LIGSREDLFMPVSFSKIRESLPTLGIGLGLRRELADETIEHADQIDFLELVPENYMRLGGNARQLLDRVKGRFPLVTHGINLSVGSTDELNKDYLKALKSLLDEIDAPWWSDHLCFTSIDGVYMQDLLPLPFSKEAVHHISERVKRVQDYIERPFLLENISFYMYLPGNELQEADFMTQILEKSDCGLLLDVNNVYVNATNLKFDAIQFLDAIPMERTVQMHIAGHKRGKQCLIDTHGAPVIQPVYELLECVLKKVPVKAVMLERDQNFPEFHEILDELSLIRSIAEKFQPELLDTGRGCCGSSNSSKESKDAHALTA